MSLPSRRVLERLYACAITANLYPPEGVYARPSIGPAPFYDRFGRQFVWDLPYSALTVARIGGHADLARGFVENMLDFQLTQGSDAGMVPRHIHREGHTAGQDGSQAPLLAWLASELHRLEPDPDFVRRVYPKLAAFVRWYRGLRRDYDGDGLSEYAGGSPTFAVYESGHDFGPEKDVVMMEPAPVCDDGLVHDPLADVTLNAFLYMEMLRLAELAETAAPADRDGWIEAAARLRARMNEAMWDPALGAYMSCVRRDLVAAQPRHYRITPAMLVPLWCGVASEEQGQSTIRLLKEEPERYPMWDGTMEIRLGSADRLYHGYQVVTRALCPSAGQGPAAAGVSAGEVEKLENGWRSRDGDVVLSCRWDDGRYVPGVHFMRTVLEADVHGTGSVDVSLPGAEGAEPLRGEVDRGASTLSIELGGDPLGFRRRGVRGLRELVVRARGVTVSAVRLRWWRLERRGLLSPYGIKSAHPLDGKHPAPGAPTDFWSGTIWGPHQLHGCQALARYGEEALAEAIADAYMQTQVRAFTAGGSAYEHHDFRDGSGLGTSEYTWGVGTAMLLYDEFVQPGSLSGPNALGRAC